MDSHSHCVIWDVTQGTVAADFSLGSKPLVDLQWLETNVSTREWGVDRCIMFSDDSLTQLVMCAYTFVHFLG